MGREESPPMSTATETASASSAGTNDLVAIRERVAAGHISWAGPLLVIGLRPTLFLLVQAVLALYFFAMHRPTPLHTAAAWWTVYGTVVDIGCLCAIRYFTLREGIRLRDLIGPIRLRFGRDVFVGLGLFVCSFPIFIGGSLLAQVLLYGSLAKAPVAFLTQSHVLPIWGLVYSFSIWWIISSATEETTYQGYALPRLRALTGRTWVTALIVGIFWAAQHCMLPFVLDGKYLLFRFLAFIPGILTMMLIYLRTKRLAPLIVAHWSMDIVGTVMTAMH
jgi:hypothetical protein